MTKQRLFYGLVIAALYLSALENLLRGMVRAVAPALEILVVLAFEPWIYVAPLFLAWYGIHDRRFVLLLGSIILLVLFYPLRIQGDPLSYMLGFKLYFACLFYIPIIRYLSKFPGFEEAFLKHFACILTAFAVWGAMELFSTIFMPDIALRIKSLALLEEQQMQLSRPIGMALDFQTGALAVAIYCIVLLLKKQYVWFSLLFALSYLLGMRQWFAATVLTFALVLATRLNVRKPFWIIFVATSLAGIYVGIAENLESYLRAFTVEGSSGQIILERFLSDGWFLVTEGGIFPNGFLRLGYSPIFGEATADFPQQYLFNEIGLLRMHYELGGIVTLTWLAIMYYPFLSQTFTFHKNHYMVILFLSSIGFVHYLTILKPFILIFLIFCSIQAILKQELPGGARRSRFLGRSNSVRPPTLVDA